MKRKEKNYIKLGEDFEIVNNLYIRNNYSGLYDCYGRPSERKAYIYDHYMQLIYQNSDRLLKYGIASYNCHMITLEAEILKDSKLYYLYITPSHNYIMEIEEA